MRNINIKTVTIYIGSTVTSLKMAIHVCVCVCLYRKYRYVHFIDKTKGNDLGFLRFTAQDRTDMQEFTLVVLPFDLYNVCACASVHQLRGGSGGLGPGDKWRCDEVRGL